jgi:hypothetical protein
MLASYQFQLKVSSHTQTNPSRGIATFPITFPVSMFAALTMPSVPAEKSTSPSALKHSVLQLPLCRLVSHSLSTTPNPFSNDLRRPRTFPLSAEGLLMPLLYVGAFGEGASPKGGRRYVSTWPEDKPTAMMGCVGWIACEKMSERRGMLQMFSNMAFSLLHVCGCYTVTSDSLRKSQCRTK